MSQNDFVIDNQTTPLFRSDLNSALQALASNSSGTTEPTTRYANQWWYDESTNTLKFRSEANDAWINIGTLDQSLNTFTPVETLPIMPKIATWTHSTNVNEVNFIDLGDWDQIEIECVGFGFNAQVGVELLVSFNNGSTYQTSGYASFVFDSTGDSIKGSGLSLSRGASNLQCALYRLSSMASAGRSVGNGTAADSGGANVAAGLPPAGVVNAILLKAGYSSSFTAGTINIYGVRRA